MSRIRAVLASAVAFTFAVAACEGHTSLAPDTDGETPTANAVLDGNDGCQPTGTGLTAVVVNQDVIGQTVIIGDCDVGAFFDEDGHVVRDATFEQPDASPDPDRQSLVRVEGADLEVRDSEFDVNPDYGDQIVHVGYRDGATGEVVGNTLTGRKRAGILLDGGGTVAAIVRNELTGVGPTESGWAENGIQVSRGATSASVRQNVVRDHWWTGGFCSSGIIVFKSDDVPVTNNQVFGSDCGVVLWGDGNDGSRNDIEVRHSDTADDGFVGVLVVGDQNSVQENVIRSDPTNPANYGILDAGTNTTISNNVINGFRDNLGVGDDDDVVDDDGNVVTPAGEVADQ